MVLGKLDMYMPKNRTDPDLTPYTKINSEGIRELNNKTLRRKHRAQSPQIWAGGYFSDITPKAQATRKKKPDKLDFVKI